MARQKKLNEARKAAIFKSNSQLSLFRLPQEIKDIIWGNIIGEERIVHIYEKKHTNLNLFSRYKGKVLRHHDCSARLSSEDISERDANEEEDPNFAYAPDQKNFLIDTSKDRRLHLHCQESHIPHEDKSGFQFLATCRHMHAEISQILYERLTFSFKDPDTFTHFITSRNPQHKNLLRNLHIDMLPDSFYMNSTKSYTKITNLWWAAWNASFCLSNIAPLTGLKVLTINLENEMETISLHLPNHYSMSLTDIPWNQLEPLLRFRMHDLQEVNITSKMVWTREPGTRAQIVSDPKARYRLPAIINGNSTGPDLVGAFAETLRGYLLSGEWVIKGSKVEVEQKWKKELEGEGQELRPVWKKLLEPLGYKSSQG